jgi:DSF synthase
MNAPVDFKAMGVMFQKKYDQIEVSFEPEYGVAWTFMKPSGAPCFNVQMLEELRAHDRAIESCGGRVLHRDELHQIRYYVGASKIDGIFSLGGNLTHLVKLIRDGERDTLAHYAKLCVDSMFPRLCNYNSPLTTISLVQGEALGGGFETALASSVIIAERRSQMGLPEILFNLIPGNGAYSLLARRVGTRRAEEMILSGRVYTAQQLHDMGVVDILAEDGKGESAVRDFIRSNDRRRNGMQAMFECRRQLHPITYDELLNIAHIWVDAAMRVEEKDLKMMSRLARAQTRRTEGPATAKPAAAEPARLEPSVGFRFAMA